MLFAFYLAIWLQFQ